MKKTIFIFFAHFIPAILWATDNHVHEKPSSKSAEHHEHEEEKQHDHDATAPSEDHDHSKTDEHDHESEHGHEESSVVGADKGILAYDETQGMKLSAEAEKNFALQKQKVSKKPFSIPSTGLVQTLEDKSVFVFRSGFYKRVDVRIVEKQPASFLVDSSEVRIGDEVIIHNSGFLRISEIAATGGAPEGHSH